MVDHSSGPFVVKLGRRDLKEHLTGLLCAMFRPIRRIHSVNRRQLERKRT